MSTADVCKLNGTTNGHIKDFAVTNGKIVKKNGVINGHHQEAEGHTKKHDHGFDFATRAVHVGQEPSKWSHFAVIPPIVLSTTYQQPAPAQPVLFEYGRSGNPTRECLEQALAALENGKHGLVFSSGLAVSTSITYLLSAGDHLICGDDVYGGTGRYFRSCASKFGVEIEFVDATVPENIAQAIRPNTKLVWLETPTNPTMKLCDIKTISGQVKRERPDIVVVIDNTFMSPYFQKPLDLGADIVMHSISKYINGHSDVIMGCLVTKRDDLHAQLAYYQNALGAVPSPFDCFLVNRGLKTLHLRMEAHHRNGLAVARYLEAHPLIEKVLHPGLQSHPQHELARRQNSGFSGMVSVYVKGSGSDAALFVKNLRLFTLAESLGGVESLIEVPSVMTHASVPAEQRAILGIDDSLVRISVGVESEKDLIEDLRQALDLVAQSTTNGH